MANFSFVYMLRRFKALIQIILISFRLNLPQTTSSSLEELFRLLDRVSRNEGYDGLNEVINDVCGVLHFLSSLIGEFSSESIFRVPRRYICSGACWS